MTLLNFNRKIILNLNRDSNSNLQIYRSGALPLSYPDSPSSPPSNSPLEITATTAKQCDP